MSGRLRVTLRKSTVGTHASARGTVRALGLRRIGQTVELPDDELGVVVGETSVFRFYSAATRAEDGAGTLIDADTEGLAELDPVEKLVEADDRKPGELVPVRLEAHVTEVGTLELWCVARDGHGRWKLEYSVRERE